MTPDPAIDPAALRRKVAWRLLPLVFLLYIISYLDRANIAFAKLRMATDLRFSEEVFGLGIGIFFIGYLFLEIPGALIVEHRSARLWFTRILITWGIISAGMAFVRTPAQFYTVRFLLGVAEAGYFPGIIVYFTHWFVQRDRARAFSGMLMAVPLSLALGAPVSALLLDVHWWGFAGWQWLFLLEGLPALAMGVVVFFYLADRPRDAKWLTPAERDHLERSLAAEERVKAGNGGASLWRTLLQRNVWLLLLGIMTANSGGYALAFWIPTTIKTFSHGSDRVALLYSCLFYSCGLVSVYVSGRAAGRASDYKWRCVGGMAATGLFLAGSAMSGQSFAAQMWWLCAVGLSASFWACPFWTLPTLTLPATAAAVAIGSINMGANLAGFLGNFATGWILGHGGTQGACLLFLAGCYVTGAVLVSAVTIRSERAPSPA